MCLSGSRSNGQKCVYSLTHSWQLYIGVKNDVVSLTFYLSNFPFDSFILMNYFGLYFHVKIYSDLYNVPLVLVFYKMVCIVLLHG